MNKILVLSIARQRKLVNLLFFWEEELVRWRLLSEEERRIEEELNGDLSGDESQNFHLREALQVLAARKRVRPSLRDDSGRPNDEVLPGYWR